MLFSVIVPVYNKEKYIKECIASILSQSEGDFELIVVNDGSTDSSQKILDEFATMDTRVRVIHRENAGVHVARMMGTKAAMGEYLVFVDSDDTLRTGALEVLKHNIEKYDLPDIVLYQFKGHKHLSANADVVKAGYYDRQQIEKFIIPYAIESKKCEFINGSLCDKAFKRELFRILVPAEGRLTMGEDRASSTPFVLNANSLVVIEDELYYYRINPNSAVGHRGPYSMDNPRMCCEVIESLADTGKYDLKDQLYRCLTHNIFVYAKSQFARKDAYMDIKKEIINALSDPYYQNAIRNCHYGFTAKGWMAYICARFKLIWVMKVLFDFGM